MLSVVDRCVFPPRCSEYTVPVEVSALLSGVTGRCFLAAATVRQPWAAGLLGQCAQVSRLPIDPAPPFPQDRELAFTSVSEYRE